VRDSNSEEFLSSLSSLNGKVAVVTGGTGELCGSMAEGLAAAGAEVFIVGRNEEKASARLARIDAAGGNDWFHSAEATSRAEIEGLLEAVLARSGRVDIVVNGAGITSATLFFDITEEEFDRIVEVNLKGVFFGCQVFGKYLVDAAQGGSIIHRIDVGRGAPFPGIHVLRDQERSAQPVVEPCPRVGDFSCARQRAGARIFSDRIESQNFSA
jgi:NAD(P)-dependent dehydrogenase (short-subunit alcohol dehydrogenase family)